MSSSPEESIPTGLEDQHDLKPDPATVHYAGERAVTECETPESVTPEQRRRISGIHNSYYGSYNPDAIGWYDF